MSPRSLVLTTLLMLNLLVCRRIVKHYHYHFDANSPAELPLPSWASLQVALYRYSAKPGLTNLDVAFLSAFNELAVDNHKVDFLTSNGVLGYITSLVRANCQETLDFVKKLGQLTVSDSYALQGCKEKVQAMGVKEQTILNNPNYFRRLGDRGVNSSN